MILPKVHLLFRIVLDILSLLFFPIKLRIAPSRSIKNRVKIMMGTALNPKIAFSKIAIFTMLILPIHDHGKSFHLLRGCTWPDTDLICQDGGICRRAPIHSEDMERGSGCEGLREGSCEGER